MTSFISAWAEAPVSRLELLEKAYDQILGKKLTEIEAMQSGLLEAFPDGKYHLDWPITRGLAARVLFRVMKKVKDARSCPGFFSDIGVESPFYPILGGIGGAFQPLEASRFSSDSLLTPEEANDICKKLVRYLPGKIELTEPLFEVSVNETGNKVFSPKSFDSNFIFPKSAAIEEGTEGGSETARVNRLMGFVPPGQIAPQSAFDLRTAGEAMDELEQSLPSFETTVSELAVVQVNSRTEANQIREGLVTIREVITPVLEKLEYSLVQLSSALLVDSESILLCAEVKRRIKINVSRLNGLKDRIEAGLAKLPKETQP